MLKKNKLNFFVVGTVGFVVDYVIFIYLCNKVGFLKARVSSFAISTAVCWLLNRRFTFDSPVSNKIAVEGIGYYLVAIIAAMMNITVSLYIFNKFGGSYALAGIATGCLLGAIFNFWALQKLVYKNAAI